MHHSDLDPTLNPGATYIAECQYVTPDDALAGNNLNNASYRLVNVTPSGGGYSLSFAGGTERMKAAVEAWADLDPFVNLVHVDVPNDGRFTVAQKVDILGGGTMRFVWAVHNLCSHRSAGSFQVQLPAGATVSNMGFHDVDYHSNEVYDGTDWTPTQASNGVIWETAQTYAQDVNANALRWGTTYTFWMETDSVPTGLTIGLFRPGTPTSMTLAPIPFPSPDWQVNSDAAHLDVDGATNNAFTGPIAVSKPIASPGTMNLSSTLAGQPFDIALTLAPAVPNFLETGDEQHVNIDLLDPSRLLVTSGFGLPMPVGPVAIPFATPPGTFAAQLVVLEPGSPDGFRLSAAAQLTGFVGQAPSINVVNPNSAAVGSPITLIGTDFVQGLTLTMNGLPVPTTSVTSTQVGFNYPAGVPCDAPIVVTNPDAQSGNGVLNPTPVITNHIAQTGPASGGVNFGVIGSGFAPGTTATIGGVPATVTTAGASIVLMQTPPGSPGTVPVVLTTPGGCGVSTTYTYQ